jgi:hypothetical protein
MDLAKKRKLERFLHERPGPSKRQTEAEREELQRRKQQSQTIHSTFKFRKNTSSVKVQDIRWSKLIGAEKVSRHGVFYVAEERGAFVLKSMDDMVSSYFASLILKKLQIPAPEFRLLQYKESQYSAMIMAMENIARNDEALQIFLTKELSCPFLLLYEYIPSLQLADLGPKRAHLCFEGVTKIDRERLLDIGRIISADIFLNNGDRFPMIWENSGNSNNILFQIKLDNVFEEEEMFDQDNLDIEFLHACSIDTRVVCIKSDTPQAKQNLHNHLTRLGKFLEKIFNDLRQIMKGDIEIETFEFISIKKLTKFISDYTLHSISPMSSLEIIFGITIGFSNIVNMGMDRVSYMLNYLKSRPLKDVQHIWSDRAAQISLDFLGEVHSLISHHLTLNIECVKWAEKMSLGRGFVQEFSDEFEEHPLELMEIDDTYDMDKLKEKEMNDQFEIEEQIERKIEEKKKQQEVAFKVARAAMEERLIQQQEEEGEVEEERKHSQQADHSPRADSPKPPPKPPKKKSKGCRIL